MPTYKREKDIEVEGFKPPWGHSSENIGDRRLFFRNMTSAFNSFFDSKEAVKLSGGHLAFTGNDLMGNCKYPATEVFMVGETAYVVGIPNSLGYGQRVYLGVLGNDEGVVNEGFNEFEDYVDRKMGGSTGDGIFSYTRRPVCTSFVSVRTGPFIRDEDKIEGSSDVNGGCWCLQMSNDLKWFVYQHLSQTMEYVTPQLEGNALVIFRSANNEVDYFYNDGIVTRVERGMSNHNHYHDSGLDHICQVSVRTFSADQRDHSEIIGGVEALMVEQVPKLRSVAPELATPEVIASAIKKGVGCVSPWPV